MRKTKPIDFEIIKEPWNKYQLVDNSILKTRAVLKKVERVTEGDKTSYKMDVQNLTVIYADSDLKGTPNPQRISKEEMAKSIDKPDMRYDTLSQEFNEYLLDDGTKLKIFTNVTSVSRASLKDSKGDPIYHVQTKNSIEIKQSNQFGLSK
ncbi:MAG: hypothetical protein OES14_07385 [Nitrosopumilus sp.]|nr:hypothetical protein [Nitrosopumilus sp.]MDH3825600.1 hypothetical protein [Nitrosopumilus sp.]